MLSKSCKKYLSRQAEQISLDAVNNFIPKQTYTHALVVPMCNEHENCFQLIENMKSISLKGPLITAFVINHHEQSSADIIQNNQLLRDHLVQKYQCTKILDNCFFINLQPNIDVIVLEMCGSHRLNAKQGVGLARKIGCDFILGIINQYGFKDLNWINSTDADVSLPKDYFLQLDNLSTKEISACVYNFIHKTTEDNALNEAINLYEDSLHQYVNGLKFAGSQYAYHTIGSLIAVSSHHYPLVRGFPKISGAEDFYMLNKLAKIAPVHNLPGDQIKIQTRLSNRVPFGTGPALKRILDNDSSYIQQLIYPQKCFQKLQIVIWHINQGTYLKLNSYTDISEILTDLGFFLAIDKIEKNNSNIQKRIQHIHNWFDAFKTLKFIRLASKHQTND